MTIYSYYLNNLRQTVESSCPLLLSGDNTGLLLFGAHFRHRVKMSEQFLLSVRFSELSEVIPLRPARPQEQRCFLASLRLVQPELPAD
jgi:hypothetical protein